MPTAEWRWTVWRAAAEVSWECGDWARPRTPWRTPPSSPGCCWPPRGGRREVRITVNMCLESGAEREKLKMGSERICMNIEAWCWIGLVVWLWWLENNWGHMQHTAGPGAGRRTRENWRKFGNSTDTSDTDCEEIIQWRSLWSELRIPVNISRARQRMHSVHTADTRGIISNGFSLGPVIPSSGLALRHQSAAGREN